MQTLCKAIYYRFLNSNKGKVRGFSHHCFSPRLRTVFTDWDSYFLHMHSFHF